MKSIATVLLLPGWQNSGPQHWQSRWEAQCGWLRVEQHDWMRPLRGDWSARLEEVVLAQPGDVVLAAHSLGCLLAAHWAGHSHHAHRVRGALLVAPPDTERDDLRQLLPGWAPVPRGRLPFAATVVASRDDPYSVFDRSSALAGHWNANLVDAGPRGHLNADSGLGDWPAGQAAVAALAAGRPPLPLF
jgi:predicted alpha/beta hydrolase family esterase